MLYILDPENILGEDCGFETFKALRNRELRQYNEYRTQRLVLEAWSRLAGISAGAGRDPRRERHPLRLGR
jgi:hypothetical protein